MNKPRYIVEAEALIGEKEVAGKLANKKIVELYADAGSPSVVSDEVPWCAAAVGACLARANKPNTGTLLARDYYSADYRAKCVDHGKTPVMYSIGVMKRGNSGWEGHVGFVVGFDSKTVSLLGGNQANAMSVRKFPRSSFIGFVTPKDTVADKKHREVVRDSRRLTMSACVQRLYLLLSAGLTAAWQYSQEIVALAKDNAGLLLLGTVGFGWLVLALLNSMSVREYREGRYLPKSQWK